MSLVLAPGKYLILIFLFLDIFSSKSPDIVKSCKISVVRFLHSPFFFLYTVGACAINVFCWSSLDFFSCVNLFIRMFLSLLYFTHQAVLSFWTAGRLLFERLIKIYTRWFTCRTFNSFITNRCIKFANYLRGILSFIKFGFSWTELKWCGIGWKFLFPCWQVIISYIIIIWLFQWF